MLPYKDDVLVLFAVASGTKQPSGNKNGEETLMTRSFGRLALLLVTSYATTYGQNQAWLTGITEPRDYLQKRVSSYDHSGGNRNSKSIEPGESLTIMDESGPGIIVHKIAESYDRTRPLQRQV